MTNEALCEQIQSGDRDAEEQLVRQNKGYLYQLADRISHRYDCRAVKDDLVQAGALALLHTAKRFDPARGTKLLTYATIFLRAAMAREARAAISLSGGRRYELVSLERFGEIATEDGSTDPSLSPVERKLLRRMAARHLASLIRKRLTPDEQEIVIRLYGFGGRAEVEISEVARIMMLHPDSVRRAHKRALDKLRRAWLEEPEPWRAALEAIRDAQRESHDGRHDAGLYRPLLEHKK